MPWHEPRLTGASGEPTVREGQGKLTRAENFYQRGAADVDARMPLDALATRRASRLMD
jgi:hypothetical protein